jgi:hypothetical protein
MKFGFKFGKSKEQAPAEEAPAENVEIVDQLIQSIEEDGTTVKPHAPLGELSLDAEQDLDAVETPLTEEGTAEEEGEAVKLVELKAEPPAAAAVAAAAPPPPQPQPAAPEVKKDAAGKPADPMDISATINSVFTDVEDEENPLANLIKTLPDVAATELMDDLKEINDIMKDWKKH